MSVAVSRMKRYNLALPEVVFQEIQAIADARGVSVVDVLRGFIKLGLLAVQIENTPDASLVYREGDREQRIILL